MCALYVLVCLLLSKLKNKINFKKGKEIAQEPPSQVFVLIDAYELDVSWLIVCVVQHNKADFF